MADTATQIVARGLRLSRHDPDVAVDATEGLEYLNEIHKAVLTAGTAWPFLVTTGQAALTAGTRRYTFSSLATALGVTNGIERIIVATNDTDGSPPLKGMDQRQLERLAYNTLHDAQAYPTA